MNDMDLFDWGDTTPQPRITEYQKRQAALVTTLTKKIKTYTEYQATAKFVEVDGVVNLEIPRNHKSGNTGEMLYEWITEIACSVLTIIRQDIGFKYRMRIPNTRGQGTNGGWEYEVCPEKRAPSIDHLIAQYAAVSDAQLVCDGVTIWANQLDSLTRNMYDILTTIAKNAIHYFLHTMPDSDAYMFELEMCGYDI